MQSSFALLSIAALFVADVTSSPINMTTEIPETGGLSCGGFQYTQIAAQNAYGDAISMLQNGQYFYNGASAYPKEFRNGQAGDPEVNPGPCTGLQLYELPILQSGAAYAGGSPGPDRAVVADSNTSPGSYEQCFLMTHTGAASYGLFVNCV